MTPANYQAMRDCATYAEGLGRLFRGETLSWHVARVARGSSSALARFSRLEMTEMQTRRLARSRTSPFTSTAQS